MKTFLIIFRDGARSEIEASAISTSGEYIILHGEAGADRAIFSRDAIAGVVEREHLRQDYERPD